MFGEQEAMARADAVLNRRNAARQAPHLQCGLKVVSATALVCVCVRMCADLINVFEVFLPQLLLYPNPTDPLNGEAAALLMREPQAYEQRVKGKGLDQLLSSSPCVRTNTSTERFSRQPCPRMPATIELAYIAGGVTCRVADYVQRYALPDIVLGKRGDANRANANIAAANKEREQARAAEQQDESDGFLSSSDEDE